MEYDLLNRKHREQEKKKKNTVKKVRGLHVGNMAKSKRNHSTNRNKDGHERVFLERKRAKNRRAIATLER